VEKHTSYFNLLEQLKDPACPLCAQVKKSLQGFLDGYLYEGVNDDANWNRLTASKGWCSRHARDLEGFSDGLAVALFYRHLLRKKDEAPRPGWFRRKQDPPACPACVYQGELEEGQVRLFAGALAEPEFIQAAGAHPGLCLPHVSAVSARLKEPEKGHFLELAGRQLEALCRELDEIVKKSDYRNAEKMGKEGDAWKRALRRYYGLQYGN
jgi:hypothetical protein